MDKKYKLLLLAPILLILGYSGLWYGHGQITKEFFLNNLTNPPIPGLKVTYDALETTGFPFKTGITLRHPKITYNGLVSSDTQGSLTITKNLFGKSFNLTLAGLHTLKVPLQNLEISHKDLCLTFSPPQGDENLTHIEMSFDALQSNSTLLLDHGSLALDFRGALSMASPKTMAKTWRDSVGSLDMDHLKLQLGKANLHMSATLVLDEDLQPVLTSTLEAQSLEESPFQDWSLLVKDQSQPIPLTIQGNEILFGKHTFPNLVKIDWDKLELITEVLSHVSS